MGNALVNTEGRVVSKANVPITVRLTLVVDKFTQVGEELGRQTFPLDSPQIGPGATSDVLVITRNIPINPGEGIWAFAVVDIISPTGLRPGGDRIFDGSANPSRDTFDIVVDATTTGFTTSATA